MARTIVTFIVSIVLGCAGGVGSALWVLHHQGAVASVLRARSFELVDGSRNVVSRWGIDQYGNPMLAFTPSSTPTPLSLDNRNTQRVLIGLSGDGRPLLLFQGDDKKPRVQLWVSEFGQPVFSLYDESSCRAVLGVRRSDTPSANDRDWGLDFLPDRAGIGMGTVQKDGRNYAQGYFYLHQDQTPVP
ncbi:MAG: hypothetical protein ABSB39_15600 [Candidatus Sulfotelmatobacter sp.]|jgi:hypothetical protein